MYKDVIKTAKQGKEYIIFNRGGMLLSLNEKEYHVFVTFGNKRKISPEHREFLSKLASYGVLEFEGFTPKKTEKTYDLSLMDYNSPKPIYPAPTLAHLAITNKCNMACRYCSVRGLHSTMDKKELSTEQWKKIISNLSDWGVFQIGFTGGEPTLRKDLPELARYVNDLGCVFNLTTNGWSLDEGLIDELKRAKMKQCQVSLDSHIPEIHDRLRGEGSWRRVVKAIKLLNKNEIAVGIDCVVSKNNISNIQGFVRWIEKENIPYLTLIKLKKGSLSDTDYKELALGYKEYSDLIKTVCSRKENENPNITLDCGSVSNLQAVAKKQNFLNIPIAGCPLGHHLICISPNGDIYPCAALLEKQFCLGNILKDDIRKIWTKNLFLKELRMIKEKIKGKCKECERLDICRGGCRGITFAINKGLFESDPSCNFQNINFDGGKNEDKS